MYPMHMPACEVSDAEEMFNAILLSGNEAAQVVHAGGRCVFSGPAVGELELPRSDSRVPPITASVIYESGFIQ